MMMIRMMIRTCSVMMMLGDDPGDQVDVMMMTTTTVICDDNIMNDVENDDATLSVAMTVPAGSAVEGTAACR